MSEHATFFSSLKDHLKADPTLKGGSTRAKFNHVYLARKIMVCANSFFRLPKMGFDNKNKDLTAANAGRADIFNLMHGTSGQGQKTA